MKQLKIWGMMMLMVMALPMMVACGSDDGQEATVSINGNSMTVTANGQVMKYTKYDGTPQQLIDYLNKK